MPYQFRNLVFEGGGVKGIAYVGAMEALGRRRILPDIVRVGGTSAGAINATLFALGYSNPQVRELLAGLNFKNFLDADWGVLRDSRRLLADFGWYKGDFFRQWIAELIARKLGNEDATFADLRAARRPDLYVYGTNLSTHLGQVFSVEHTPAMSLADAVRISMSIPLFFAAVRSAKQDLYVDGGLLDNYPVKLFDRLHYIAPADHDAAARRTAYYSPLNRALARRAAITERPPGRNQSENGNKQKNANAVRQLSANYSPYIYNRQTLGLRLDSPQEISAFRDGAPPVRREIDDFFDYARALIATVIEAQATQHLHSDDWQRTVYIDTLDVATTDFDLSDKKKQALLDSGRDSTNAYFEWFNDQQEQPVNRI